MRCMALRAFGPVALVLLGACAERHYAGAPLPDSATAQIRSTTGYAVFYEWGTCLLSVDSKKVDPAFDAPATVLPGAHTVTISAYRYIPLGIGPCLTGKTRRPVEIRFDAVAGRRYFVRTTPGANGVWIEDDAGSVVAGEKR